MTDSVPPSFRRRMFYKIPILGWTARDINEKGDDNLLWGLATVPLLWACLAMTFGYPGIIIPALILVPVIFLYLVLVSWG